MTTQKQMRLASHDEGFDDWTPTPTLQRSSTIRRTAEQVPVDRTRPMPQRASRPAALRQSDPTTNGDPSRLRPATDRQHMVRASRRSATATQAQPLTAKTYLLAGQEKVGNRQQRRQTWWLFDHGQMNLLPFIGLRFSQLIIVLVFLWFLAALAHMIYQNTIGYPAEFGAAHSSSTYLVDHQHRYYLLGSNDQGQSYIMLIPAGQPEHAKLLVGPRIPKDAYVRVSAKDVNGDGAPDIVEEIVPQAGFIFEQQPLSEIFLNDGHDNFKPQQ